VERLGAVVDRCHEVDSGARIIDRVLSGTMLPELSTRLLSRMAEGEPVETIEVGWDQTAGEFSYRIG
jgi:type VI secretion system protein VasG